MGVEGYMWERVGKCWSGGVNGNAWVYVEVGGYMWEWLHFFSPLFFKSQTLQGNPLVFRHFTIVEMVV